MDVQIEKVMDRNKVATSIHSILDAGVSLLLKDKLDPIDFQKIKVFRTLGTHVNAAVTMVQLEVAQLRAQLVSERMKQLGYNKPEQLEG